MIYGKIIFHEILSDLILTMIDFHFGRAMLLNLNLLTTAMPFAKKTLSGTGPYTLDR